MNSTIRTLRTDCSKTMTSKGNQKYVFAPTGTSIVHRRRLRKALEQKLAENIPCFGLQKNLGTESLPAM